jgi:MFS family permease
MQAGSIVVALAAWAIIPWLGWRWFAVACGIPPLVSACLVAGFVLESPRFLLAQGHAADAAAVVEHMFRRNGVALRSRTREVELQENVASPEEDGEQDVRGGRRQLLDAETASAERGLVLSALPTSDARHAGGLIGALAEQVQAMLSDRLRSRTLLLAAVWVGICYGWYGLNTWIPTILKERVSIPPVHRSRVSRCAFPTLCAAVRL